MQKQRLFLLATVKFVSLAQFLSFTETTGHSDVNGRNQFQTKQIPSLVHTTSNDEETEQCDTKLYERFIRETAVNYGKVGYDEDNENVQENYTEPITTETENSNHRSNTSAHKEHFRDFLVIRKCCSGGEEFSHNSTECVSRLEKQDNAEEEILYPPMEENMSYWVPPSLRSTPLIVTYSYISHNYDFSATLEAVPRVINRFLKIDDTHQKYELGVFTKLGDDSLVTKQVYCFEKERDSSRPFVIFTAINVAKINKCCKKGQQLDSQVSYCVSRPGHKVEDTEKEFLNLNDYPHNPYWSPFSSGEKRVLVTYYSSRDYFFKRTAVVFKVDSSSNVTYNDEGVLTFSPELFPTTQYTNLLHPSYCVDAVERGLFAPNVLVALPCYFTGCIAKCCLPGDILSNNGHCRSDTGIVQDNSSVATAKDSDNLDYLVSFLPATCLNNVFETEEMPDFSDKALLRITGNYGFLGRPKLKLHCVDWQHTATGIKKVYGTCTIPPNVRAYERTRPLGAVTAVVLAAAAVAAVARADTRRTAHGRALACHALCLCACSALQVAWFLKPKKFGEKECTEFAYPTYFFMVAANFWLFSITLNMFCGFMHPLGSLSSQGAGAVWKRFALLSSVAWGGAAVLTAFSIAMHTDPFERKRLSYVTPSFAETRQCYIELPLGAEDDHIPLNSLLYYFTPMAFLVGVNIIFILCIALKMQKLKKDASFLHADHNGRQPSSFKSALVYVRLLLLAGVVELSLEVVAWTTRSHRQYHLFESVYPFALENYYNYVIAVTLVDALRALGVLWMCVGPAACHWRSSCAKALHLFGRRLPRPTSIAPQDTSSRDLQTQVTRL